MELDGILFGIATVLTFINGYIVRKGSMKCIFASAMLMQANLLIEIFVIGPKNYIDNIGSSQTSDWLISLAYITFFWVSGYIVGGINLRKKKSSDEFNLDTGPKYMGFDFDDKK